MLKDVEDKGDLGLPSLKATLLVTVPPKGVVDLLRRLSV